MHQQNHVGTSSIRTQLHCMENVFLGKSISSQELLIYFSFSKFQWLMKNHMNIRKVCDCLVYVDLECIMVCVWLTQPQGSVPSDSISFYTMCVL